jgi:hypothetical protein
MEKKMSFINKFLGDHVQIDTEFQVNLPKAETLLNMDGLLYNDKLALEKGMNAFYKALRDSITFEFDKIRHVIFDEKEKAFSISTRGVCNYNYIMKETKESLGRKQELTELVKEDIKHVTELQEIREGLYVDEDILNNTYSFLTKLDSFISEEIQTFSKELQHGV